MSEPGPEEDRQTERRPSVSSLSETHHESKPSPASVTVSDQDSEYMEAPIPKKKAKKPKPRVKMELVDGDVTFTTDCEVKQTPTVGWVLSDAGYVTDNSSEGTVSTVAPEIRQAGASRFCSQVILWVRPLPVPRRANLSYATVRALLDIKPDHRVWDI